MIEKYIQRNKDQLNRNDYLLLVVVCLLLFGISLVSNRALSIHESVLPQSAREMLAQSEWVIPSRGGAPWIENPPLPQWITITIARLVRTADQVWVPRIGSTLMGMLSVLLVAWMASQMFSRVMGILSGLISATSCEFVRYAWLAEDEIYLCALVTAAMAMFVKNEFSQASDSSVEHSEQSFWSSFWGTRSVRVSCFFVMLGMTNLAKGVLFGAAMVVIPIIGFLIWNRDRVGIKKYSWFWGWLLFGLIGAAWPLASYLKNPGVIDVWTFDLLGRLNGDYTPSQEPIWYYPVNLLWMLAPWTFMIPLGFWKIRQKVVDQPFSPERFICCWALLVPLAFSIPSGKHHHYLLHALAPWSMIAASGLIALHQSIRHWPKFLKSPWSSLLTVVLPAELALWFWGEKIPGSEALLIPLMIILPPLSVAASWAHLHQNSRIAARGLFSLVIICYCVGHVIAVKYADHHRFDAQFLSDLKSEYPQNDQFCVDLDIGALNGMFCLFYLGEEVKPIHNLSFLRDQNIQHKNVYVLTRYQKRTQLSELGQLEVLSQSPKTGRERSKEDRLTLFRLTFAENLMRISAQNVKISPMQAMYRAKGPSLSVSVAQDSENRVH